MHDSYDAKLIALHVVEFIGDFTHFYAPQLPTDDFKEAMKKTAATKMEELFSEEEKKGVDIELLIKEGKAFYEIIQIAKDKHADLIVISTHGRTGMAQVNFGSVAEKVIRKAPCSVFVAKRHRK